MFGRYDFPSFWHQFLIRIWSSNWANYSLYSNLFAQGKVQKSVFRRKNRDNIFCLIFFNFNFEFCLLFSFYSFEIRFCWFLHTNMSMEVTKYTIISPYAYEWPYAYAYDHMAIWPYKWPSLKTLKSHNFYLGDKIFLKIYVHTQDV